MAQRRFGLELIIYYKFINNINIKMNNKVTHFKLLFFLVLCLIFNDFVYTNYKEIGNFLHNGFSINFEFLKFEFFDLKLFNLKLKYSFYWLLYHLTDFFCKIIEFFITYLFIIAIIFFGVLFELFSNILIIWVYVLLFIKYILLYILNLFFFKFLYNFIYIFFYFVFIIFLLFFEFIFYMDYYIFFKNHNNFYFLFLLNKSDCFFMIFDMIYIIIIKKIVVTLYLLIFSFFFFKKMIYYKFFLLFFYKFLYYKNIILNPNCFYGDNFLENFQILLYYIFYFFLDFVLFFSYKIKVLFIVVITTIVPFSVLKYLIVLVQNVYSFISLIIWLCINLIKFLLILFFQMLRKLDMFGYLIEKKKYKDVNEEMVYDEEEPSPEDELFGNTEKVYQRKKNRRFMRVFYFSSFYFTRQPDKRGNLLYDERPFLNLNKFIWTRSNIFNRPLVFVSFLRKGNQNTYKLMKNSMYYKDFFSFVNKTQKYRINYFSENFFFSKFWSSYRVKIVRRFSKSFSRDDPNSTFAFMNDENDPLINYIRQDYYRKRVSEKLNEFYTMKATYFTKYFFRGKRSLEKEEKKNFTFNLRDLIYSIPQIEYIITKISLNFLSFFKKFFLLLADINRIDLYFLIKSTFLVHVSTIFFEYNLSLVLVFFIGTAIGADIAFLEEERINLHIHLKDEYDLKEFFSNIINRRRIIKRLQPELFTKYKLDAYLYFKRHKKKLLFLVVLLLFIIFF
jgi:hypothetical protein